MSKKIVIAEQIKSLYAELYAINLEIHNAPEAEIKGAIGRVTGKDGDGVTRIYNTFRALCNYADFNGIRSIAEQPKEEIIEHKVEKELVASSGTPQFHYNIQIHLPATTDISVYNAIFKSLKDNLLM